MFLWSTVVNGYTRLRAKVSDFAAESSADKSGGKRQLAENSHHERIWPAAVYLVNCIEKKEAVLDGFEKSFLAKRN